MNTELLDCTLKISELARSPGTLTTTVGLIKVYVKTIDFLFSRAPKVFKLDLRPCGGRAGTQVSGALDRSRIACFSLRVGTVFILRYGYFYGYSEI